MIRYLHKRATVLMSAAAVIAVASVPLIALAHNGNQASANASQTYAAHLSQLNDTGASGEASLKLSGRTLHFSLEADGLEPGKTHPMHIHGKDNPEVAACPTNAQDTNNDGFVSVVEGAGQYGLIKLNLTNPQTPFGPPATTALFTPFAGKASNANFPVADASGHETFDMTYVFDNSAAAEGAFQSLMPLENQHIVLHGAEAPGSVDADAFAALGAPVSAADQAKTSYDALLPVACGKIYSTGHHTNTPQPMTSVTPTPVATPQATPAPANTSAYTEEFAENFESMTARYEAGRGSNQQMAKDAYVRDFYEARNHYVDQLNRSGNVMDRDKTSSHYQMMLESNIN